jgi:hypothetical protein
MTFKRSWIIGLAAVLTVAIGCTSVDSGRGRETRETLVQAYLTALQAGDQAAMLALVNPRVEASAEVAATIAQGGGKPLKDVAVSYVDEFGGTYIVATVIGKVAADGSPFRATVPMGRENGRYYLALGQAKPTGSEAGTASPSLVP